MKAIKDKIVMSDVYYFVLAYLHATDFAPIKSRNLCEFDKTNGRMIFKMDMLDYLTFKEMLSKSENLTLENIDKYNLK